MKDETQRNVGVGTRQNISPRLGAAVDPSNAPSLLELTKALVELCRSTNPETNWSQKLGAKSWTPVFSASPEVLQNTHNDTAVGRFLPPGISCLSFSSSTNETGTICNQINPFFGGRRAATFRVEGTYTLNDRTMTLEFEQLTIRLLGGIITLPSLDIREGRGIRSLLERLVRGGKKTAEKKKTFEKRPNTYFWFYADEHICVAQGSSGSVAVWVAADDQDTTTNCSEES
ncbi:expressed unknown protein [Seminavis robusta]|uniref:Uncharacterized protein n=1 Tax=Seminavis robusta TaxID=568900 RepID=A0A9N8EUI0_9STRA|nr:expressed unknown protein [Seminavis robusta]|eukprot:Sro1610_g285780.1 n/a (230) ;mRNA; r:3137-4100